MAFICGFLTPDDDGFGGFDNSFHTVGGLRAICGSDELVKMNPQMLMIRIKNIGILYHQIWKSVSILRLKIKRCCKTDSSLVNLSGISAKTFIEFNQI